MDARRALTALGGKRQARDFHRDVGYFFRKQLEEAEWLVVNKIDLMSSEDLVSEIHTLIGGDLSTVSKHLTLMREAGWLACDKKGLHIHDRLACDCLDEFLRCVDTLLFHLAHKQTDCLAKELCLPDFSLPPIPGQKKNCNPTTGCC